MEAMQVGIREFRADLANFIVSTAPVAVTRHKQTVGYFIPTQGQHTSNVVALKRASKVLDQLLLKHAADEESMVHDFKKMRRQSATHA